jgi:trigger factor
VDFDASLDGSPLDGGSSRNHPLIIGGKSFMPGFEEELVGLAAGMSKEFSLTAPADYYEPKLAGKRVEFTVTLKRVQAVLKPAVDDAFARTIGQFADLAALRASITAGIRKEKEEKEHQRVRAAILDAIIAGIELPTPEFMVRQELDAMLVRFDRDLQRRGLALPMYLARIGTTEEKIKAGWRTDAERQVRMALVLRQLAKERPAPIAPEELDAAVQATVAELARGGQDVQQMDLETLRAAIAERMVRDGLLALLERECAA